MYSDAEQCSQFVSTFNLLGNDVLYGQRGNDGKLLLFCRKSNDPGRNADLLMVVLIFLP
jgi:hypothetical protein